MLDFSRRGRRVNLHQIKIDLKATKLLIDVTEKKDLESFNGDEVSLAIAPFRGDVQTGIYRSKSSTSDPVYRGMVKPDGPFDIVGRKVGGTTGSCHGGSIDAKNKFNSEDTEQMLRSPSKTQSGAAKTAQ